MPRDPLQMPHPCNEERAARFAVARPVPKPVQEWMSGYSRASFIHLGQQAVAQCHAAPNTIPTIGAIPEPPRLSTDEKTGNMLLRRFDRNYWRTAGHGRSMSLQVVPASNRLSLRRGGVVQFRQRAMHRPSPTIYSDRRQRA